MINVITPNNNRKMTKKPDICDTAGSSTGLRPSLIAQMVCGRTNLRMSRRTFLISINTRRTFIPPPVEPAQPPMNINRTSNMREVLGQALKSAVVNPVVVMIEVP